MKDYYQWFIYRNREPECANTPAHLCGNKLSGGVAIMKIDNQVSEIKVGNTTFLISSYFKEHAQETIEQKLIRLICQNSENVIAKPNS